MADNLQDAIKHFEETVGKQLPAKCPGCGVEGFSAFPGAICPDCAKLKREAETIKRKPMPNPEQERERYKP